MAQAENASEPVSVAIYLRVSSDEQARDGYSLTTQETLCREKLDSRFGPDLYVPTVYSDDGFKGRWGLYDAEKPRKKFRPDLTRMHEAFKDGAHQIICVWELSRIYRRADLAQFLDDHFRPHGLEEVISCREPVDMRTASGRFQVNVMAAVGAFEVERLGERVSDGLQQRMREGYMHRRPYGWRQQTDEEMAGQSRRGSVPDEAESEVVKRMVDDYMAGGSVKSVTRWLNDQAIPTPRDAERWTRATVKHILGNSAHAGLLERDGELVKGQHYPDRLYDPEVYHQIQARMERNSKIPPKLMSMPEYLLAGLLRCGHCGAKMNCNLARPAHRRYYRCTTGTARGSDVKCTSNQKPADVVETAIISQLKECARDSEVRELAEGMLEDMVEDADRRLREDVQRLEGEVDKRLDEFRFWSHQRYEGEISAEEFDLQREQLMDEKTRLEEELEDARAQIRSSEQRAAELDQALEILDDFDATFDGLTLDQQREMLQLLVSEARMFHQDDGNTRIAFTIRALGDFERVLPKLSGGDLKMTPRQMEAYMLWAEGLDRNEIAQKMGIKAQVASQYLSTGKSRVGADSRQEAYEMVRDQIEANQDILSLNRRRHRQAPDPDRPLLTDRQTEVLTLWAEGLKADQVADELEIGSPTTVYVHLKDCRDRLGCASNEEAVRQARKLGYIE